MKKLSKSSLLIMLCWLVYTCSYIGKLSYNANINQIGEYFNTSYTQTGMVTTFFFFAYGIGQIVNGIMCKKYNIKYVIFISLIVASIMNVLIINVSSFTFMKYCWLINGVAMSFLWTSLIRLLSETLEKKDISKAVVVMGTTVASGTFLVYGLSALFVAFISFKVIFYLAAIIMSVVSIVWLISFNKLVIPLKNERIVENSVEESKVVKNGKIFSTLFIVLAFFAIANNFIKDGLTAWTPDILSSIYDTPGWLSILLTVVLPLLAIFGTVVAVKIDMITKNSTRTCVVLFGASFLLIGIVLLMISKSLVITLVSFAFISCLMAGVNNVITSMIPLKMKDEVNSGMLAGLLNGFCYLCSTVSSFGLGLIADNYSWISVFYVLFDLFSKYSMR